MEQPGTPMKYRLLYILAGASLLAVAAEPAPARGNNSDHQSAASERGNSGEHGKSGKNRNTKSHDDDDRGNADGDHANNSDCGLGRRDHGDEPAGARDPDAERGGDCPASADHGGGKNDGDDDDDLAGKALEDILGRPDDGAAARNKKGDGSKVDNPSDMSQHD